MLKRHTREDIYNKIPEINNYYYIFTNKSERVKEKHSIDDIWKAQYNSSALRILDLDNNILYYYEYAI